MIPNTNNMSYLSKILVAFIFVGLLVNILNKNNIVFGYSFICLCLFGLLLELFAISSNEKFSENRNAFLKRIWNKGGSLIILIGVMFWCIKINIANYKRITNKIIKFRIIINSFI